MKITLETTDVLSDVTKRVIADFNIMSDAQFMAKYFCHKDVYLKRVMKYGDPYVKAPLAKIGKFLMKLVGG